MTVKPKVLYHASPNNDIEIFEPRLGKRPRDFGKDLVVFATDSLAFATHFLVTTGNSWTADGAFNNVSYFICSDRDRFLASDKGGTIYSFPSNSFTQLKRGEWFSKTSVKPISKTYFSSGLQAMLDHRVQFYFVDKDLFQKIEKSLDHGLNLLKSVKSENEIRGINFVSLP